MQKTILLLVSQKKTPLLKAVQQPKFQCFMLSANQYLLPLWKRWAQLVKKYLSTEPEIPETIGVNPISRRYSNKHFSRSKLNIKIRSGRIFGKLVV